MGREAADRDSREGMADGIERRHARSEIARGAGDGEEQINTEQRFRGAGNSRRQFAVLRGPCAFCPVKLHAADAQHG